MALGGTQSLPGQRAQHHSCACCCEPPSQPFLTRPAPAAFLERASPAGTASCVFGKHGHSPSLTMPLGCGVRGALGSSMHVLVGSGTGAFLPLPLLQSIAGALEAAALSAGPASGESCEVLS